MIDNNIIYKHAWKTTRAFFRKLMSKKLQQEKLSKKQKKEIKNSLYLMYYSQAHFQKPASKYFGEIVEMDASSYDWADVGEIWHLHLAVDSHSGAIVGANFDSQETLKGYYKTFKMMYLRHGAPAIIFSDRRTVFVASREGKTCESLTNFAMVTEYFETILKQSSVPQAKGKVERLNGILQNKLSVFLKIKRIKTMEEANEVLEEFINYYNQKFNKKPISKKSYFTRKVSIEKVNSVLAIYSERTFNNGSAFKYKNRYYLAYEDGLRLPIVPKTKGTVIETLDDKILIDINKKVYPVLEISEKEFYSQNIESFE